MMPRLSSLGKAALDQLEEDDRGAITKARAKLDDARVAAGTLGVARRQLIEDLTGDVLVVDVAEDTASRCHGAGLAERDHLLCQAADCLGLGLRGADLLVLQ